MIIEERTLYRVSEKCTGERTEGEPTPQYKNNILCEHKLSEAWFSSDGLLNIKENYQIFHREFPYAGIAGDRLAGPYFFPELLTGAVYHSFLQNAFQSCCKRWSCRLGFIYGS